MGGSNTTTTTTKNEVPKDVQDRGRSITQSAMALPTAYQPQQRNAPVNPGYEGVKTGIAEARNAFTPYQTQATNAATASYEGNRAQAPAFDRASLDRFTNPYEADVISGVRSDAAKNLSMGLNANRGNAAAAGAFGGGRHGVVDAVTTGNVVSNLDRTIAGLRSDNYNRSVDNVFRDNAAANAAAGQNFNQGMTYAGQTANLGQMGVNNLGNANNAAFALTNQLQGINQSAFDRNAEEYTKGLTMPYDFLQRQAAINAGSPYTQISTSTQQQPSNTLGTALYAAGSFLPVAMGSDERIKENVEDLDPEKILGAFAEIPTKSYDYRPEYSDTPITGPGRRDGFMAQDYERAFGAPSREIDGVKVIDVPQLLGRVVTAIKGLEARTRPLKKAH